VKRQNFIKVLAAGSVGAATLGHEQVTAAAADPKRVLMKVGCQSGGTSTENLEFKARHGVFNLDGGAPKTIPGKGWDLDTLRDCFKRWQMKRRLDA
jgi:mannonate dehydratase